ncbi:MAG: diaminopimelate epimerase [Deltaproteobacteria bacterium RBG_13_43_22]|nr:MAG: diaminopimelate epimerase [Deltaproteobacteria bacterium RBG_13_43_22]
MNFKPSLKITKMSGSGNDFILMDNRSKEILNDRMAPLARALCRRMVSVGADGMIFIEPSDRYDFKWRFFNADGSEAEMCGNGGRCTARFAFLQGIAGPEMTFETLAGPIQAWVEGSKVKLELTQPKDLRLNQQIDLDGKTLFFDFLNTGVPHTLIGVEDLEIVDLPGLGPRIRYHEYFKPAGTNVNFFQLKDPGILSIRTYERGVEGETLACGTGSVAAAAIAFYQNKARSPVQVQTRGGEILTVYVEGQPGQEINRVYLEGKVRLIFQGEVFEEALL